MTPTSFFRVEGNVRIGTGHVMRCLTLADALGLRGYRSVFVCRSPDEGMRQRILKSGHVLHQLPAGSPSPSTGQGLYGQWLGTTQRHDADAFLATVGEIGLSSSDLIIVDHYGLDREWEALVKAHFGVPMLAIDDIERHHSADVLLDTTFGKSASDYADRVPQNCQCMVGARYALLRPDFAASREQALAARDARLAYGDDARAVLVSMGGSDAGDATGWVLDGMAQLPLAGEMTVHILVGTSYPHGNRLAAKQEPWGDRLVIHSDVWQMASLLAGMDLAIGASGSSAWERCCVGLPTIQLVLAENQRTIAQTLAAQGASEDGGSYSPDIDAAQWARRVVLPMLANERLQAVSRRARQVTDGKGVARVVETLLALRAQA